MTGAAPGSLIVEAGDAVFSFLQAGSGPPLVLLHRIGSAAVSFCHQLDELGYADGEDVPLDIVTGLVSRMTAAVSVPISIDLEAGYGDTPEAAAVVASKQYGTFLQPKCLSTFWGESLNLLKAFKAGLMCAYSRMRRSAKGAKPVAARLQNELLLSAVSDLSVPKRTASFSNLYFRDRCPLHGA